MTYVLGGMDFSTAHLLGAYLDEDAQLFPFSFRLMYSFLFSIIRWLNSIYINLFINPKIGKCCYIYWRGVIQCCVDI